MGISAQFSVVRCAVSEPLIVPTGPASSATSAPTVERVAFKVTRPEPSVVFSTLAAGQPMNQMGIDQIQAHGALQAPGCAAEHLGRGIDPAGIFDRGCETRSERAHRQIVGGDGRQPLRRRPFPLRAQARGRSGEAHRIPAHVLCRDQHADRALQLQVQ